MKIPYRWLLEYVNTKLSPEELGDRLTYTSSELESITNWETKYSGLKIGKVISLEAHPNANKLKVAQINLGEKNHCQIVCGAPNIGVGQSVVIATPGTILNPDNAGPLEIKEAEIRGVKSAGMICSAGEIGIPGDDSGILVLDFHPTPGTDFATAFALDDTVLDLETTPNRADLNSLLGIAREVATFDKKRLSEAPLCILEEINSVPAPITIEVIDARLCPRYTAIYLENIKIKPSPLWLQARLIMAGMKPITLIVDVLNYVMLETGQPMHVFDFDRLIDDEENKKKILVRPAVKGESIIGLDNMERKLNENDIVIANAHNQPIAIAGIIGSIESGVNPQTTRVIIESANFSGKQIRKTSRALGLRTEASSRYERGLDPELTVKALKRVVCLLTQLEEGIAISSLIDIHSHLRKERPRIHLTFDQFRQIVGINISTLETKSILQNLGFQITSMTKSTLEVIPPTWRADVEIPEDVVEELVRIWGYDRIPSTMPGGAISPPTPNPDFLKTQAIRAYLASEKQHECVHLTLTSKENLRRAGYQDNQILMVPYPLSQETECLIPSHLYGLLNNIGGVNLKHSEIKLFEIGHVFGPGNKETNHLSVLWRSDQPPEIVLGKAKAELVRISKLLLIAKIGFERGGELPSLAIIPESLTSLICNDVQIGTIGQITPATLEAFKVRSGRSVFFAQISLDALLGLPTAAWQYQPPPAFPSIERDLTIWLPKSIAVRDVTDLIDTTTDKGICQSIYIQSIYFDKPVPPDHKSLTIHMEYNASNRTLKDEEVNQDQARICTALIKQFKAQIK